MKFVFISKHGDILPIAQRIEDEGNNVDLYICEDESWINDKHITEFSPDVIVIDSYGFGIYADRLRKQGFKVVGGSSLTDKLEDDRIYEERVLKAVGLTTSGSASSSVSVDGWFNGKEFVGALYSADGVSWVGDRKDVLFEKSLGRLANAIRKSGYAGVVSLTCFFSKNDLFCKDLKARFSAASMLIMREGLKGRLTNLLYSLAYTQNRMFMYKPGWFTSVQISISPNELFNTNKYYELEVNDLTPDVLKHLWLFNFAKRAIDRYVYRGKGGRLAVATARGDTIREARRRAYRTAYNTGIKNALFPKSIGSTATSTYSNLKEQGMIA